jgi:hypothetical protein
MSSKPRNICVYCASSQQADEEYYAVAGDLGRILAEEKIAITYGGGAVGLMGALADSALRHHGEVIGVLPEFMDELEWGHGALTELQLVPDMHERKQRMIDLADAIVALPGGCGTLEELLEAITWKRLGLHGKPIVLVNTRDFYRPLVEMLQRTIDERFMRPEHAAMWSVVDTAEAVLPAILAAPPWDESARSIATL